MKTRCLYGDSTPFPWGEGFLENLRVLTSTCVDLLQVAHTIESSERRIAAAQQAAEADQAWLARLGAVVEAAVRGHPAADASGLAQQQAQRVADATLRIIESGQQMIVSHRDGGLREHEQTIQNQRQRAEDSLEQFLLHHSLPETIWGISWQAGPSDQSAEAEAVAMAPCGIEAGFRLFIPDDHRWSGPVRVDELGELTLRLPLKGGKLRRQRLSKLTVQAVDLSPNRISMTILRKRKDPSRGFELESAPSEPATIRAIHEKDGLPAFTLEPGDAQAVDQLVKTIRSELRPLISRRVGVSEVTLAGTHRAMEIPGEVAQVMIGAVAPCVREIVRRGPARGELSLKRDLGNGRREELFLPVARLVDRILTLPTSRRGCFDPFGLPALGGAGGHSNGGGPPATPDA